MQVEYRSIPPGRSISAACITILLCSLLKNSSLSIAEIAVSVGFFDQFYFSRVFKKVKGVPPSKYLATLEKEGPAAPQAINP